MNTISFMTANYYARQLGYDVGEGDWGHGDRSSQDYFRSAKTFPERFEGYLKDIQAMGFDTLDLWTGILHPVWATEDHVDAARRLLKRYNLKVSSLAGYFGNTADDFEASCNLASELGCEILGGGCGLLANREDRMLLIATLRKYGLRYGYENHPEKTPQEALNKLHLGGDGRRHTDSGEDILGITADTGWWATQGYNAPTALRELGPNLIYVHLKDVREVGTHETCRFGEGVANIEGCVQALKDIGYTGAISIEHEPEHSDPTEDVIASAALLRQWLGQ